MHYQARWAFHGNAVHSVSVQQLEYLTDVLIGVAENGVIEFMERGVETSDVEQTLRSKGWTNGIRLVRLNRGEFLLPGLIDCHTHAPQYPNIGFGYSLELLDWLNATTFPREKKFENPVYAKRVYEAVVKRLISAGTTTAAYYASHHLEATKVLADIIHKKGQRAFVGKCNMDRNSGNYVEKSASDSLKDTKEIISHIRLNCNAPTLPLKADTQAGPTHASIESSAAIGTYEATSLIHPIVSPRFAISCSEALLSGLGALCNKDPTLAIQSHLSENLQEIEVTKKLFPFADNYASIYDHFGLLHDNTILGHCVHLEKDEVELIKRRNAGVAHCPSSNIQLRSGALDVGHLLNQGIKVGLGTDVGGGFGFGILSNLREASVVSKALTFKKHDAGSEDATPEATGNFNGLSSPSKLGGKHLSIDNLFFLATLGGAQVCCLDDRIGNFEVGKEFDALLIQTGQNSTEDILPSASLHDDQSRPEPCPEGLNPALFVDPDDTFEAVFEKFLFTGDDRNIGCVFVRGRVIGGARPIRA